MGLGSFNVGEGLKGAIAGGPIGSLVGFWHDDKKDAQEKMLADYRKQILSRGAPQLGPANQATTSDFRTNQQYLIGRLEALANGQGPSLATAQLEQANDRNMAQQQSIAQSGRGNPTLANIVAANNANNFGQQAAQQASVARVAEQLGALQQLGGVTQGARAQDEQGSQFNAQQQNFAAQANLEAKLRAMGLNDQAIMNIFGQQSMLNQQPTAGDQLLAGATGALGMAAGNYGQANAGRGGPKGLTK